MSRAHRILIACLVACLTLPALVAAQSSSTIAGLLTPGYPFELVSARKADRIAWLAYEHGLRNAYTAAAPDFRPVRVTRFLNDDGVDISGLSVSDDGGTIIFVRGYVPPGRDPRTANPTSNPDGAERTIWAARTTGVGGAWRLAEGSNPVLSPDGRFALFLKDGQIYRVPTAPGPKLTALDKAEKPFIVASGTNSNPRWSPDAAKIAFVSDRVDHSFIGVYDLRTRTLSFIDPGVDRDSSPTWSGDGKRLAFIRRPGLAFGQQAQQGTGGIGNPPGPAYNPNAPQGRGQTSGGRGGGQAAGTAQGRASLPGLNVGAFKGGYTLSFWVADIATGAAHEFWHPQPSEFAWGGTNAIQWAGDQVLLTAEPGEWLRFYAVSVAGTTTSPVAITPDEGLIEGLAFTALSPDGGTLYYCNNAGDIDRRHVWKVPTSGGTPVQLTKGEDIETYPVPLASGKSVALLSAGATRPQSVGLAPADGGAVRILFPTLTKAYPADVQVVPQSVITKADDGTDIHNQLFLPKDMKPGEKRPAMVFVHGGPVRQMLLGYHYMHFYHIAYAVNQWLASQGYVVLSINYRGGVGYGRSFRNAPNRAGSGNAEYQDVVAGGRYLQSRPDVDVARIGIWGLSYGGLLTAQALARNSDMFCGGVDLAGVHLYTNLLDAENVAFKSSAVSQIEKWTSPVLLVHGDDDRNVAFTQTTGLVQMLRARNVPYELIVFPDDVHESLLHTRWQYTFDRMEKFLNRVVKRQGT